MLRTGRRKKVGIACGLGPGLCLALLLAVLIGLPGTATAQAAATCQDSGPSGGAYTVSVCLTDPGDGAIASGPTSVTAAATVTGTSPGIRRMTFYLGGNYLLTDYQAPYTFTIPSDQFVDGSKTLEVEAWMRDGFISQRASISLLFSNGVITPPQNTKSFTPTPGTDPGQGALVVAAAGDGAGGETSESDVTNLIASWNPNLFLYLGDVYEKGTLTEFYNWYRPTDTFYGRFRSITDPTIGNHEYENGQAPGYFNYWDNVPHYYSFNTHGWHLISLDANSAFNQTAPGSPQYEWLVNDLNSNTQPCTLAYWHEPLYNIGQEGSSTYLSSIWSLLAQNGVDLVVNGHDHTYQRWTPLDGSGNPSPSGITEIVAGTGGHAVGAFVTSDSRLVASATDYGALKLVLNDGGASYQFTTRQGQTLDSGSVQCNPSGSDSVPPSTPANLTATATYKTKIDLSWNASTDNVGVTGYEVYRDGQPLLTVGAQTTYSDTSVLPGSTHTYKVRAVDAAANVSGFSNDATATTPTVAVLFHDGFESGTLSSWTQNNGLIVQQSQVFAGAYAAEATASGGAGASAYKQLAQTETNLYYVVRFKIISQSTNVNLLRFRNNALGANAIATLFVSSTSKLGLRNDVTAVSTTSTTVASARVWHTAQAHVTINGSSSATEVWLDGTKVPELSQTGINLGTNPIGRVELADPSSARTFDVAFDEVAYDREFIGDLTPPTAASNLAATAHSGLEVDLSWTPGSDDVGISGYDVYRNGSLLTSIGASSSYADKTVSPLSSYTYKLVSKDAAGNVSGFSNEASATTGDVFTDTFESGNLSKWTTVAGLTAQQASVDGGQWAAEAASTGSAGSSAQVQLDSIVNELYYRVRFKLLSQGPNSVSLLRFRTAANGALASAFVASTGKLGYRNDTAGTTATSTQTVFPSIWHELQMHLLVNGGSSQVEVWLDGVKVIGQADSLGTSPIGRLELGDPSTGRTFDVALDNVVADPAFIADAAAPTAPSNLHTTSVTASEIDVAWDAANDDVGVTGYRIYRNAAKIGEVDGGTFAYRDTTVADATHYTYAVTAIDAAAHESSSSNAIQVTTSDATKPSTPTGLTATPRSGANVIDLSWSASTDNVGVTGYRIYRNGGATPVASVDGSTTSYADTDVQPLTTYSYAVTAVDAAGNESDPSATATASTADTVPPSKPAGLSATAVSGTRIDLSWSASTDNVGVTGYRIYRNGGATPIASVDGAALSYSDTNLTPATSYTYTVKAIDAAGNASDASDSAAATTPDTIPPSKVAGLSATAVSATRIDLSWSASTDNVGVTGYRIYRNGGATPIASVDGAALSYSDTGLSPGTSYTYTVKAVDAAGNTSDASDPATANTPDTVPPSAPSGLTATAVSDTQVNLAWGASSDNVGVTGYRIYRNGSATPIASVGGAALSYSDTGLTATTVYTYTVKAVDAANNVSGDSNSASATTAVFGDGFETGNFSRWTSVNGLAVQNTEVYAGSWAAEAKSQKNTVNYATKQLPSTYTNLYYRLRLKILVGKPDTADVLRFRTAAGANLLSLFYGGNKKNLGYLDDVTGTSTTSTTALSVGIWYDVKVHLVVNGASSQVEVWLNGTKVTALSKTDSFGTTPIGQVVAGESTSGRAFDFAIDEVLVDTKP